jgi:hypothetical protein
MAQGLIPSRGDWKYRAFTTTSTATFVQGSAVKLNGTTFNLSEYSGGETTLLGIAMHSSASSLPAGSVLVAIPGNDHHCMADVPTGLTASQLSRGVAVGLYKSGNTLSTITLSYTSTGGHCAFITGALDSARSRIEIQFYTSALVFNSSASVAYP